MNLLWKTDEREAESIVLLIFALWWCFNCRWMRGVGEGGEGRKCYLGPAEITSFSSRNFNRNNEHDTFWHVVSNGYLYFLFLWTIADSNFRPLEICKKIDFPLSVITFTVNSHAENHFHKHIYLIQMLYSMKSVFLSKYTLRFLPRFFNIQIWFKWETPLLIFLIRTSSTEKKLYRKSFFCCRLCKNYWITYCTDMTSHAIWVDEIADVIISIKRINKS